jgi:hypothetical protein
MIIARPKTSTKTMRKIGRSGDRRGTGGPDLTTLPYEAPGARRLAPAQSGGAARDRSRSLSGAARMRGARSRGGANARRTLTQAGPKAAAE